MICRAREAACALLYAGIKLRQEVIRHSKQRDHLDAASRGIASPTRARILGRHRRGFIALARGRPVRRPRPAAIQLKPLPYPNNDDRRQKHRLRATMETITIAIMRTM